jgi:hypothetical protein
MTELVAKMQQQESRLLHLIVIFRNSHERELRDASLFQLLR